MLAPCANLRVRTFQFMCRFLWLRFGQGVDVMSDWAQYTQNYTSERFELTYSGDIDKFQSSALAFCIVSTLLWAVDIYVVFRMVNALTGGNESEEKKAADQDRDKCV